MLNRRIAPEIETTMKTTFKFLADTIPDVRSLFIIRGKRYVCEKLTATFAENCMSQVLKGVFYPILENSKAWLSKAFAFCFLIDHFLLAVAIFDAEVDGAPLGYVIGQLLG